ncbi:MAG: cytochrome ubiquinol oxidase subunit I [Bacteroidota bacterium]|nr:cytochrome ubiquinol oxidase subunit I [Bacteroidota bacterium]
MDVVFLSRLQFALTVMFHYLFPPLSIGLGTLMVVMEGMYLRTKDPHYETLARFWTRIFALVFVMGVASGIVMEFQFGTNWASYSRYVGDVFGSALAAEGIFAFFLESSFLAILVFGWDRVSPRVHFFSTLMVALGAILSAVWIVTANSWQQTPAGFHIVVRDGFARAEITNFWAVLLNPPNLIRLAHTLVGAWILGAFAVMSVSAWYILKSRHIEHAKKSFLIALAFGTVVSLLGLFTGHLQSVAVAETQPAKLAAYEGIFKTEPGGTPMYIFGIPDSKSETVRYGIAIPGGLSFLVHFRTDIPVPGLDRFPPNERPPVFLPFVSYHLMVGLGLAFIALTLLASWLHLKRKLWGQRALLWVFVFAFLGPYAANQFGWVSAEVGRQPWVVYGLLRTSDGVSKVVSAGSVLSSIVLFGAIYLVLFVVWSFILSGKIRKGIVEEPASGAVSQETVRLTGPSSAEDATDSNENETRNIEG